MNTPFGQPAYTIFAEIYDQVMRDVDYHAWSQHVLNLCDKFGLSVRSILDLACGSGMLAVRLASRGYAVTGVDASQAMLEKARKQCREWRVVVPLYCAGMDNFALLPLDQEFDLVTCLYDSLNYLLEDQQVQKCFHQVYQRVRPGGAFIFDVTTEYNLLHNFAGFTFAENLDHASYIWENEYDILNKLCHSKVTVFLKNDSHYQKGIEEHIQKVYPTATLTAWLQQSGFEILGLFHNLAEEPPQEQCERIHFVCRKP